MWRLSQLQVCWLITHCWPPKDMFLGSSGIFSEGGTEVGLGPDEVADGKKEKPLCHRQKGTVESPPQREQLLAGGLHSSSQATICTLVLVAT